MIYEVQFVNDEWHPSDHGVLLTKLQSRVTYDVLHFLNLFSAQ